MRVWDVAAGYLDRQSLLGEHRELHGLYSILYHGKAGYSRHPETVRWVGCQSGLAARHAALAAEMALRGYCDRTPLTRTEGRALWPTSFVTTPRDQFTLLASKYRGRESGRIPLPRSAQELWGNYKYSVMARSPETCREMGRRVAGMRRWADLGDIVESLVLLLREPPRRSRLVNALEHMWGHVAKSATAEERRDAARSASCLLATLQRVALRTREPYLLASTALSDLAAYVRVS